MAAEVVSPVDELTGMPLPILPVDKNAPSNWHHHFHPNNDPKLQGANGRALRYSRVQYVSKRLHDRYHKEFFGPPLPGDDSGRFLLIILSCAGYIPRQAIDVSHAEPRVVGLHSSVYEPLRKSRRLGFEARKRTVAGDMSTEGRAKAEIGKFLCHFVIEQDLPHLEKEINRFLNALSEKKRRQLGSTILRRAIEVAAEPVEPIYREAWRRHLVEPALPNRAATFISKIVEPYLPDYVPELEKKLLTVA